MKSAPIDPEVAAAQIRRQAKSPRVRVREEQKATKKAWLASSTDRDTLQVKAAPLEKDRLLKKRKRAEMKAAGSERAGKGRSLRNVRKEKRALKLLEAAGNSGMGADAGGLGLNRMAKRMMARGKVTGQ